MAGNTVVFEMEKFLMAKRRRPDGKRRTSEPLPADAVKAVFDAAAGNPHDPRAVPRGKFIGTRVGGEPENAQTLGDYEYTLSVIALRRCHWPHGSHARNRFARVSSVKQP